MIAASQITIRDENDMQIAAPAPANPTVNTLWLDTSVTPNMLKRWNGTAWVECGAQPTANEIVVGTQTAATGVWTGVAGFAQLVDGQQITYWLPYPGSGSATLTLTLSDGTATEAIPCYYSGVTRLSTHYPAGNAIHFTYRENAKISTTTIAKGWWADANYDSNYYDRLRSAASIKAKSAITAYRLIVGDSTGFYHLAPLVPFDVSRAVLYAYSAIAANASSVNCYLSYPSCYLRYQMATFTGAVGASCYLVGTLVGSTFTPISNMFTTTVPTTEDGYTYMLLGLTTSAYYVCLYPEHPLYRYVGGAFKPLAQVGYEAHEEAQNVQTNLTTAISQTNTAIALKADKTVTDSLGNRLTTAEGNITTQAGQIALKVNTSTYNAEKVYRGTTAPASPSANTLWLDTSLSPNILKRWTGSAWAAMGAQELKTSGITIGQNNVSITTEQFLLQLLDPNNNENILMEMSASGNVGFKELYADEVISDSVPLAYHGPSALYVSPSYSGSSDTYFRSLGEAVTAVNNRYLPYDLYIYLPYNYGTVYEYAGVQLRGVSGPGKLVIYGYSKTKLASYITIKGCSAHIVLQYVSLREIRPLVNGTSRNGYLVECQMNHFVEINGCTLDANGTTYDSVYVRSSHVVLINCGLYNALQGLEVFQGTGVVKNCSGSCSWAMVAYAGIIFASGTVPAGSRSSGENGQVYATGVTINYGTAIPTVTPDETTIQYATLTKSWRGSWRTDTVDVVQGVYSDYGYSSSLNWNRGCMWFGNLLNVLSGTTVSSATLTLHRKTGSGSGAAKTVYLCAITNTSASGTPSIAANYGALGTIGRGATVTFGIPIAAVQGLANGTYGGLCLYESPYNFGSSTYSNCYMRMSGTDESSYKPYLTVVYSGGISWG